MGTKLPVRLRTLRQDPAEVAVYRPDLKASGVICPRPAALRAGAGQLLIPSDPTIAAMGKVSQITEASPVPTGATSWRGKPVSEMTEAEVQAMATGRPSL
jgi:hypothetical protein